MKDYYGILGIGKNATPREIKRVYLERVKMTHPDRFVMGSADWQNANAVLGEVNEAYACLRNAKKRKAYDVARSPETTLDVAQWQQYPSPERNERYRRRHQSYSKVEIEDLDKLGLLFKVVIIVCLVGMIFLSAKSLFFTGPDSHPEPVADHVEVQTVEKAEEVRTNHANTEKTAPVVIKANRGGKAYHYLKLLGWPSGSGKNVYLEMESVRFLNENDIVFYLNFQQEKGYIVHQTLVNLKRNSMLYLKTESYDERGRLIREENHTSNESKWEDFRSDSPPGLLAQWLSESYAILQRDDLRYQSQRKKAEIVADYIQEKQSM